VIDGRSIWAESNGTAAALVTAVRTKLGPDQPLAVQVRT
jgi:hypothetical protein